MSDAVWLAIIGVIAMCIKEYFDRERSKDTAKKVETVRTTLLAKTDSVDEKLAVIAVDLHKVELASNSMKDALVTATEKEALARGGAEERDRAEAIKKKNKV